MARTWKKQRKHCTPIEGRILRRLKIQTKDKVSAELMAEHVAFKKTLGNSDRGLGSARHADQIVDFVRRWSEKAEIGAGRFIRWLDIAASKFYDGREPYRKLNEHNG
jgi:hypothetical protein